MNHTVKGFNIVSEAEVDVFPEIPCFSMIQRMLAIWSLVPLHFLNPACTSGSSWFTYCWSLAWRTEHYLVSIWNECNCVVVWTFFGIALLWDWNENDFSSPVAAAEFSNFAGILSAALSQHHLIVFLYPFAVITEEGFLISPCYSLEICIHLGISFPFSFHFSSFLNYL